MSYGLYKILDLMERVEMVNDNRLDECRMELLMERVYTLDEIYEKYYNNIPKEDFIKIVGADPTSNMEKSKMGKYSKWLLWLYGNGGLKLEDLYKATDDLKIFHRYKAKLDKKDIGQYNSLDELFNAVEPYSDNKIAASKGEEIRRTKLEGAEKVYEDDEWMVVVPKTEEAAKFYGKNTRWCTAADWDNRFEGYNKQGPLYININKKTNRKYQFHFETKQFMDERDQPVTNGSVGLSDGLINYYIDNCGGSFFKFMLELDWGEIGNQMDVFTSRGVSYEEMFDDIEQYGKDGEVLVGDLDYGYNGGHMYVIFHKDGEVLWDEPVTYVGEESDNVLPFGNEFDYNYLNLETYSTLFDEGLSEAESFQNGFARIMYNGEAFMIRPDGSFVNKEGFDSCDYSFDESGVMEVVKDEKKNLMDTDGNLLCKEWYLHMETVENNNYSYCIVTNSQMKQNVISIVSNWQPVLKKWYDKVGYPYDGFIVVIEDKKYNVCNEKTGLELYPGTWFDGLQFFGHNKDNQGLAVVKMGEELNVIDLFQSLLPNGNTPHPISPVWFDNIVSAFWNGWAAIEKNGKKNYINREGRLISEMWFDEANHFDGGYAIVKIVDGNETLTNFINPQGKLSFRNWLRNFSTDFNTEFDTGETRRKHNTNDLFIANIDQGRCMLNLKTGQISPLYTMKKATH